MVKTFMHTIGVLNPECTIRWRGAVRSAAWAGAGLAISLLVLPVSASADRADGIRRVADANVAPTTPTSAGEADNSRDVQECEVKVSQANVRAAPNGAVIATLPLGAVVYRERIVKVNGVIWYEMVQVDGIAGTSK
ncbi:MAG: hypothetical protein IT490_11830, partial [Candidatus Contendobacter sp.]|nr:hypothetical protein [Candidatus Contendobacter sp.]